ncbi:hypothetical protein CBF90_05990 [Microbacterium sp. AISO3]|uniref:Uncharacterized protein n=1 Tax=Microbacterium arborescens TaxID=33883 RepID=A0ABX2WNP3_9MICO|nr:MULTISPECIES: hypothetical protein [Microbacterium]APF35559.1 hypothetical protein BO218_00595 [Microbacterium paludicola]OAZ45820.1 hypothetical protein A9Z40_00885 [Microbacterium arborescens]OWP22706.1 hypothetical protein CBF90_05990 [Microbacterium sp. AISO3]POX66710.1 hypothetical protein C3481_11300 [Microbacterium sp. Ru50]
MTTPDLAPPRTVAGVVAVWIAAAVAAVLVGILAPVDQRAVWMPIALGGCLILAFVVQLASGRVRGFIERVAVSVLGALFVMGFIGIGFGLSSLVGA